MGLGKPGNISMIGSFSEAHPSKSLGGFSSMLSSMLGLIRGVGREPVELQHSCPKNNPRRVKFILEGQ